MNFIKTTLIFAILLSCTTLHGQYGMAKKFDYSILKDKILYIPSYELSQKFVKRKTKKGKMDDVENAQAEIDSYNKAWEQAMAESSYDATDYEIKGFVTKDVVKSKDPKAILLYFVFDQYGNRNAYLLVTGPKKMTIATAISTGLDLGDKNDIRLLMNMLNESLNTASELEEEGDKSSSGVRNKYKEGVVEFYDNMKDMTFLVPEAKHKKPEKAAERTADLKAALKFWKMSKCELTTEEDIEKRRLAGEENSFYWKDFPIYTQNVFITYHYNVIVSTENDDMIIGFLGKKRLKPSALEQIQRKIAAKAERYKKQLGKS